MNIIRAMLDRPKLGILLTIITLVGGIYALFDLKRETFPEITMNMVAINTIYPNASPEEVEDLITNPLEEEIEAVDGVDKYTSNSREGISTIVITIDPDVPDQDKVSDRIRRAIDKVPLPESSEEPLFLEFTSDQPVIRVCVTHSAGQIKLRTAALDMENKLKRIPNVSKVTRGGWREEEFQIDVDLDKLEEVELSLQDVELALKRRNINLPGGKIKLDDGEIVVRTIGKFFTADEIKNVIIRSNLDGNRLRIQDVASVTRAYNTDSSYGALLDGKDSIILSVEKKAKGDLIDVVKEIRKVVEHESTVATTGLSFSMVDDQSYYVARRLNVVANNAKVGILLVLIFLLFFLDWRVATFTSFGIPFSFLACFLIMLFFGATLNLMTLFGLIIVLGMVVDDAIIVGENIYRHIEEGKSPHDAALIGTQEVTMPVISTVCTTVAAFAPMFFAPGIYGDFLGMLSFIVIAALVASLFECLLLMPCHVSEFVNFLPSVVRNARYAIAAMALILLIVGGLGHFFQDLLPALLQIPVPFLAEAYSPAQLLAGAGAGLLLLILAGFLLRPIGETLMWSISKIYDFLIQPVLNPWLRYLFIANVLILAGFFGVYAKQNMKIDIFPRDLIDIFTISLSAPVNASPEQTRALADKYSKVIAKLPKHEMVNQVTYLGFKDMTEGAGVVQGARFANIIVYLSPQDERDRKTSSILDEVRTTCADFGEAEFKMLSPGPPAMPALEVRVSGNTIDGILPITADIMTWLETQEGVVDITQSFTDGKDELQVEINESKAARFGLNVSTIAQTVFSAFQGSETTIVREGSEEVPVRVRLKESFRNDTNTLSRLSIPNALGRQIRLSSVAQFNLRPGSPKISHYNGDRSVSVTAGVIKDVTDSATVNAAVLKAYPDFASRFPGYQMILSGQYEEDQELLDFVKFAVLVGVMIIYSILVLQFNSFTQPFILLSAIPLGGLGVVIALIQYDKPISMMALMGMVGLVGVVVNDAIVLMSFINNARARGMSARDAARDAGLKRLRPIMLTTVTTVAGLFPVIYGIGGYEPFLVPAAIALAYGLMFASLFTLFVVPCLYLLFVDIGRLFSAMHGWITGTKNQKTEQISAG